LATVFYSLTPRSVFKFFKKTGKLSSDKIILGLILMSGTCFEQQLFSLERIFFDVVWLFTSTLMYSVTNEKSMK
jgi:hypothetical protein